MSEPTIVVPRPGTNRETIITIPAPSEAAFVASFGHVLPKVSYLQTEYGQAAYYELLPTSTPAPPSRVLLIHGIQTPALGLAPLAKALASRHPLTHFVLVDLWGHGLTSTPLVPHTPALFHALLDELLGHLGWPDAHLVGFSFGGSTVASYIAARPEKVASAVLVAPAGLIRSAGFSEDGRSLLHDSTGREAQAEAWILDFLQGPDEVVPADWKERVGRGEVVAEALRAWSLREHQGHMASAVGMFRDGGALDLHAEFEKAAGTGKKIRCVLGEKDDVCSMENANEVGLFDVVVVPGAGHELVRRNVPEVADLIEQFWKTLK